MNAAPMTPPEAARSSAGDFVSDATIVDAVEAACARIAPTWPLDRFIAVNPFWRLVDSPVSDVATRLRSLSGAELLMPRAFYRDAYRRGTLRDEHLVAAIASTGADATLAGLRALLDMDEPPAVIRARVVDVAERDPGRVPSWLCSLRSPRPDLMPPGAASRLPVGIGGSWRAFVTQNISQTCAAYFDEGQASFGPDREGGLFPSWRRAALVDRSPHWLMGAASYRTVALELPTSSMAMIRAGLSALDVRPGDGADYLWSLLLDVNGWASWCAYRRWVARLDGKDDDAIVDLLAIRVGWEWLLLRLGGEGLGRRWTAAMKAWPAADASAARARPSDWLLQTALEIAWRDPVIRSFPSALATARTSSPALQAVFCIDVRSEVFRRALEATSPRVQTLGFAGFFGLPVEYQPFGSTTARPQLPGLLAPRLRVEDTGLDARDEARRSRWSNHASATRNLKGDPVSTFAFVEALGVKYAIDLVTATLGRRGSTARHMGISEDADARRNPRVVSTVTGATLDVDARCDLAIGMLKGMSLTRELGRLVLLVGHGSTTCNNPHAAGLDCGACCGQTGEVNARAGAALLNDPEVRAALAARGVRIPASTWFVAALHDTTTDDITLYEVDLVPASHRADVAEARSWIEEAGRRARAERARRLALDGLDGPALHKAVQTRSQDWSEVRPEWGLANNAAFIVAPREHSKDLDLQGRAFLHEYRHEEDEGYAILELIMTAPMVVTHWINFQYYASTVDNPRYGSGNKVLHNVVGGHVGVFEGNTGDLRIGLPMQSLHDGARWVHTPLRLSVFIEAPRSAIDAVLEKHATVRALVRNGWLALFQLDPRERAVYARRASGWHREARGEAEG